MSSDAYRIAVIDDTEMVRRVIVRHLTRLGFTALQAEDGESGLALIHREAPDLVLCDLRMPGLDGLEVLRALTAESPGLPFIVMSGAGLLQDAIDALKLGAWDYISKPVEPGVLEHAINKALERASLLEENRQHRVELERLNQELRSSLQLLAEDEAAGRQIQMRMLPKNCQRFGEFTLTRAVWPSAFLSGDFIDAFDIDDTHFGFYLADVSGHGVSSALVTVLLRTFVQRQVAAYVKNGDETVLSPERLLAQLNAEMAREDLNKHLTMFYGVVNHRANVLLYANAGHFPWPMLVRGPEVRVLEAPAVPIGILPGTSYSQFSASLNDVDHLAVCSDGVLEVMPQQSIQDKVKMLRELFAEPGISIERVRVSLGLDEQSSLPDDIAVLLIHRQEAP